MVYRPTVRYSDVYKIYVDSIFRATTLDRNQIIRAALFSAAFSPQFAELLTKYIKSDVLLPSPIWGIQDHGLWLERSPISRGEEKDVNDYTGGQKQAEIDDQWKDPKTTKNTVEMGRKRERREGEIQSQRIIFSDRGGITVKIG